jgi:hypothetical protein
MIHYNQDRSVVLTSDTDPTIMQTIPSGQTDEQIDAAIQLFFNPPPPPPSAVG